jgi:hypothetical protein
MFAVLVYGQPVRPTFTPPAAEAQLLHAGGQPDSSDVARKPLIKHPLVEMASACLLGVERTKCQRFDICQGMNTCPAISS